MTISNPVYSGYLADPFCFRHGETYYMVGTGPDEATSASADGRVIPMIKSRDLRHWCPVGHVLVPPEEERGGLFWAPEVATDGRRFYLYYHPCGNGGGFHVRCAAADMPEGPYIDTGSPLTDLERTNHFAIDSHVFQDRDGQRYLYYATNFYDFDETTFRGTALVVDRMLSMTRLAGEPQVVMRAHWPWQLYQANRDMGGIVADWYTLEGPAVRERNGVYYLFYSGGCYQNDSYGVDYLTATHPLGPWQEVGAAKGPQVLRTIPGVIGPGHNSIVTAPDGADYIVYHAWNAEGSRREPCIDRLMWLDSGPHVPRFAEAIVRKNAEKLS